MNIPLVNLVNKKFNKNKKHNLIQSIAGNQDQIDIISYDSLEETPSYLYLDDEYIRTLAIAGYPYVASSGWLDNLIHFQYDADIAYHINEIEASQALPKLTRKITELESTRQAMMKKGMVISAEIIDPLESAIQLKDKIQRGQEKLFQISIYITLRVKNIDELEKITRILEATMSSQLFYLRIARYQQLEGLDSILPRGNDTLGQKRNLDSSSAALTFPFISSELIHENGILYGINKTSNSLVILDRFSLHNANSIIFAQSGSGKSYLAKIEILRQLMQGTKTIVIDPEGEYKKLANSVDGSYIKLSVGSEEKINPFDLVSTNRNNIDLFEHIQDLAEIISLMASGLDSAEKAAVDRALVSIYKNITTTMPLLRDLYAELHKVGHLVLCERLEKYITGSLHETFNSQTNIKLDDRLVIFDIKDMPESLRQVMILIIANFVHSLVKTNQEKRLLVIDEAWKLLEFTESARFMSNLVRRARKHYLAVSIISQQANDFLNNKYGQAIASQSSLRLLLRQDSTTIENVASEFKLSEQEKEYLITCDVGEALVIADQNHATIKIVASEKEHPLITTNPLELY